MIVHVMSLTRTSHQQAVSFWNVLFSIVVWKHSFHNTPKDTAMAQDTSIVLPYARIAGKKAEADFVWRDSRSKACGWCLGSFFYWPYDNLTTTLPLHDRHAVP
jgi:hypothetical protein